jgi:alkanesulfonate monooxygenase SsuD/methylene tetrahydromethanopterin reductase-like flavin-dependent oxidoreductase (luciferase family)
MRHAIFLAPFDATSEPALLVDLARRAEAAGWDGFFLWDHIVYRDPVLALADPWVVMGAMAAATERLRIGPMITPPARRRPWKLARETVTLDRLSEGRLTLGLGLGSDNSRELSGFGEELEDRRRAAMLEESLELLRQCWSGEPVRHDGEHFQVNAKPFLPPPVQQPGPPIWLASRGGAKRPLRRAARYQGWFPIELAGPDALAEGLREIEAVRAQEGIGGPFDVAVTTDSHEDHRPWAAAGATWWLTGFGLSPDLADVERTIDGGPPAD